MTQFQSLSGFHARCNRNFPRKQNGAYAFQSLSGFHARCNFQSSSCPDYPYPVSIPVGFSRSLQLILCLHMIEIFCSFNPCRVFTLAATNIKCPACDAINTGFNPCRVFTLAATFRKLWERPEKVWFQSLSGFHARCNSQREAARCPITKRFNPCRVFTLAATLLRNGVSTVIYFCFNPCRVFTLAATGGR